MTKTKAKAKRKVPEELTQLMRKTRLEAEKAGKDAGWSIWRAYCLGLEQAVKAIEDTTIFRCLNEKEIVNIILNLKEESIAAGKELYD